MRLALGLALLLTFASARAQQAPLTLARELPLTNFDGRIDHMAIDHEHHRLFLAGIRTNEVLVLDYTSGQELHRISGLSEPQGVLYLPASNRLFVTNGGTGDVNLYDASTFALLHTTPLGGDADNIRYNASNQTVLVGYGGDGSLSGIAFLDPNGNQKASIPLPNHPESFQLDPAHDRVYINVPRALKTIAASLSTHKALAEYPAHGNFPMALTPDGRTLFTGERHPGLLAQYNTSTGQRTASLPLPDDCDDLFYDPAARRLYASSGSGTISLFSLDSARHLTPLAAIPTVAGARTSLLDPELHLLFVAAPHATGKPEGQPARILLFNTH